jgi:hypothetical protein
MGLMLSLILAAALLSLWIGSVRFGTGASDRIIWDVQARVAVARFERDLHSATARKGPDVACNPVLEAMSASVTLLSDPRCTGVPEVIQWEVAGDTLMRRRAPLLVSEDGATALPVRFVDHKTMLEGVPRGTSFRYVVAGSGQVESVPQEDRWRVESVMLRGPAGPPIGPASTEAGAGESRPILSAQATVGR